MNDGTRSPHSDILLLYAARGMRGFGDGFAIIILPAYLTAIGYDPAQIGIVASASLLGTALLTLAIGLIAPRHDLRTLLLGGAVLMACTGLAFPNFEHFALRRAGGVRRHDQSVDRRPRRAGAARARHAGARRRRPGADAHLRALQPDRRAVDGGRLAGGGGCRISWCSPASAGSSAFKLMFYAYAALGRAERRALPAPAACAHGRGAPSAPLGPSRGVVYKLAALFSLDAFAGGFVVQSLLALWLFERFDLSLSAASLFFFWSSTAERVFLSGGGVAGEAHRPHQHHGLYPHPVQHLSDPGGVLAESVS